jgi:hypothetical protein
MADLKPVGSEKLPLDQKLKRIMEIATFGDRKDVSSNSYRTVAYSKQSHDGNTYAIIKENSNYIIKKGKDLDTLDYLNGMKNSKQQTFSSYSQALKKLNLMFKPINEQFNGGLSNPLIGEQTKYVLNTPTPEADEEMDFSMDTEEEGGDEDLDLDSDEDLDLDLDLEGGDEDLDLDMDVDVDVEKKFEDPTKTIQKLTGKLGQKLREFEEDLDAEMIKYVINSVISAIDTTQLTSEDVEDIVDKLENEEDIEYSEEGEFDVDISGEEELDLGDDDMDLDLDLGDEEMELGETAPHKGEQDTHEMWANLAKIAGAAAITAGADKLKEKHLSEEEDGEEDVEVMTTNMDSDEVEDVVSNIEDIFNESRPQKINKSLKKYFKYTKNELQENEDANLVREHLKKDFIKNRIKKSNTKRKLKGSFKTYEQEALVKSFLKENSAFRPIGQNKRGDIVLQKNNRVVQITAKGKIIK